MACGLARWARRAMGVEVRVDRSRHRDLHARLRSAVSAAVSAV
ncbi:hypothetical protein [Amycolatopsis sp. NBC_00438]